MIAHDTMTEAGAASLARRIEEHWLARGCQISTWVEERRVQDRDRQIRIYSVRSDLVNGKPRPQH